MNDTRPRGPGDTDGWDKFPRMYAAAYQSPGLRFTDRIVLTAFSMHRDVYGSDPTYESMCALDVGVDSLDKETVSLSLTRLIESGHLIATSSGLVTLTAADMAGDSCG